MKNSRPAWIITLSLIFLCALLTSCGGIHHYQHRTVPNPSPEPLPTVHLKVGETLKILKHSRGIMWGGYIEGVCVDDFSVVSVNYGKNGSGDHFAPLVSITGIKPGTTHAIYCNRIGDDTRFTKNSISDQEIGSSFTIIVSPKTD